MVVEINEAGSSRLTPSGEEGPRHEVWTTGVDDRCASPTVEMTMLRALRPSCSWISSHAKVTLGRLRSCVHAFVEQEGKVNQEAQTRASVQVCIHTHIQAATMRLAPSLSASRGEGGAP